MCTPHTELELISAFQAEFRFLSNFWPATVEFDGVYYPSSEHAYQAAKTLDTGLRNEMLNMESPGQAKRLGATLELRPDWAEVKRDVMWHLINQKFRIASLKAKLLETGDTRIIEGNEWHDIFWGYCFCPEHRGEGENVLGKMLMRLREDLRAGVNEWEMWDASSQETTTASHEAMTDSSGKSNHA